MRGTLAKPEVHGRIDLKTIDFRVRNLGTEVQVQSGLIEISLGGGKRVRVDASFDAAALARVLDVLERR